jgi:tagatose-1,6-bisphosphate aldolase non-catalytic subunit AgaZ/GatZ
MKPIYLNMRSSYGIETVDEFTREPGQTPKEFRKYVSEMAQEYHLAGMHVYLSCRCTKEWRSK